MDAAIGLHGAAIGNHRNKNDSVELIDGGRRSSSELSEYLVEGLHQRRKPRSHHPDQLPAHIQERDNLIEHGVSGKGFSRPSPAKFYFAD